MNVYVMVRRIVLKTIPSAGTSPYAAAGLSRKRRLLVTAYVPTLRILTKLASIFVDSCLAYNALRLGSGGLAHLLQAFRQSVVPTLIVNGLAFTHRAYNPRKYALTYCTPLLDGFLSTRFPLSQLREDFNLNRQAILLFSASSYHLR